MSRDSVAEAAGDLCVVGAGIGGISAALEAARLGKRVVLADAAPELGGQSVGAVVGTIVGLFGNGAAPPQLTHGIADEILREVDVRLMHGRRNTTIVQYRVESLARWIEEAVRRAGVKVLLGAVLTDAERHGRRLRRLDFATRYGPAVVAADAFVDASGDAALTRTAGLEVREPDRTIYGTLMLTLEGVGPFDRDAIFRRLAERAADYGLVRLDGFVFPIAGTDEALVNMTHVDVPLDPFGASAAVLEGRAQADRLVAFLKTEFPASFGHAKVRRYGLPGVRQTRTIVGTYRLSEADIRSGRRFDDAILRCSWPIELHDRPEGVHWEEFPPEHVHTVPFRSLTPAGADNLVAVGRCIDADPVALSSVRVMGPCIAMGAAAAHGLDLAGSGSVHQIDLAALRGRLAENLR
jgi:glycine/D-amino acid oxidase-like deaminating enzyme